MIFRDCNKACIFIFLLSFIGSLSSCKGEIQSKKEQELIEEANSFMNRSIKFAPLFFDGRNPLDTTLWNRRNKIVLYLDSLDCTSCTFTEIRKWNVYNKELEKLRTDIVVVCNHPDTKAIYDVKKATYVNYPVFFDVDKRFKLVNNIPQETMFHTFVIGSTNQVIWVGLPIRSKESWENFCSMIELINAQK